MISVNKPTILLFVATVALILLLPGSTPVHSESEYQYHPTIASFTIDETTLIDTYMNLRLEAAEFDPSVTGTSGVGYVTLHLGYFCSSNHYPFEGEINWNDSGPYKSGVPLELHCGTAMLMPVKLDKCEADLETAAFGRITNTSGYDGPVTIQFHLKLDPDKGVADVDITILNLDDPIKVKGKVPFDTVALSTCE